MPLHGAQIGTAMLYNGMPLPLRGGEFFMYALEVCIANQITTTCHCVQTTCLEID